MWPQAKKDPVHGIIYESGFLDSSPLFHTLLGILNQHTVKKHCIVSACDAITGVYYPMSLYDPTGKMSNEQKAASIVGSASVPFAFPPTSMKDYGMDVLLIDGGSAWNNNMISGVKECYDIEGIEDPSQIVVDIIILESNKLDPMPAVNNSTMPATFYEYERARTIRDYYQVMNDIEEFMKANPDINYRYFFQPETSLLPDYFLLEFGSKFTGPLITRGQQDALKVIKKGPGASFDKFRK